jgi:uncharacterized repeat protein (TIGR02543 family)
MNGRAWKIRLLTILTVSLCAGVAFQFSPIVQAQRYARYSLTVTVNAPEAGTVTPTNGMYNYGETVRVTEQANYGYVFDGWYLDDEYQGKLSTVSVTIIQNSNLTAVFSKREAKLTITVNPVAGGTTAPSPQVWTYEYGTSVPVKQYTNTGYVFDGWYLDGIYKGTDNSITVLMNKDHQLDAYFATPETVTPKPNPNESRIPTTLAVSCKSSATYVVLNAEIKGFLLANGNSLADTPILISYSVTGGKTWTDLTLVNTDNHGNYAVTWMPDVTGDYLIKATYDGDITYMDATTIVNFAVTTVENKETFSVTSNSTLTQLSFDSNSSQLSFTVSGPTGSTGYVTLYIPKTLMADTSNLKVYLDNTQLDYTVESDGDSWLVQFNYSHSTHEVTVDLTGIASQGGDTGGQNWQNLLIYAIPITAIIIIALVVIVAIKRRKKA